MLMRKTWIGLLTLAVCLQAATVEIALAEDQKADDGDRGVGGVAMGLTVGAVKKAYGNDYGALIDQFYQAVSKVGEIQSGSSTVSQPSGVLEVMIDVVKEADVNGRYEAIPVPEGDILTQNDRYKIMFQSNMPCHLYVVQLDSSGRMDPLFPSRFTTLINPVQPNVLYEVPSERLWFFLDSNTGMETIYFIASRERKADIEQILEALKQRNQSLAPQQQLTMTNTAIVTRGIGGKRPGSSHQIHFQDGSQGKFESTLIQSVRNEFVMTRFFQHR